MILRYAYLLRGSWPRIVELAYWPTMQMMIWGLMTQFLMANSSYFVRAGGVLIAAVLLLSAPIFARPAVLAELAPMAEVGPVALGEVHGGAVEVIGEQRAARTTLLPVRSEHEMIDDQLAAIAEQVGQRFFSIRPIEFVTLVYLQPGQRAALCA